MLRSAYTAHLIGDRRFDDLQLPSFSFTSFTNICLTLECYDDTELIYQFMKSCSLSFVILEIKHHLSRTIVMLFTRRHLWLLFSLIIIFHTPLRLNLNLDVSVQKLCLLTSSRWSLVFSSENKLPILEQTKLLSKTKWLWGMVHISLHRSYWLIKLATAEIHGL